MARKKRRKKRRIRWKLILGVLGFITSMILIGYLIIILFETKQIHVTGTVYSSKQEVLEWVQSDPNSSNTLYIMWKYNGKKAEKPPAIQSSKVKMKSPWEVTVQVTEKEYTGRIDYDGTFLYFDKNGVASLKYADPIEGVPYIEGIRFDPQKVKLGAVLPVKDQTIFNRLGLLIELLHKNKLSPDKISCEEGSMILYFGGVRVSMGISDYEIKLAQAVPILAKLEELYPGQTGVLKLDNYSASDSSVRFVPDPVEPAPEG